MEATLIPDLETLKRRCQEVGRLECFITLNGGARSSKDIQHWPDGFEHFAEDADNVEEGGAITAQWSVYNHIDESDMAYETDEEMLTETHIGEALEKHALYEYGNQ